MKRPRNATVELRGLSPATDDRASVLSDRLCEFLAAYRRKFFSETLAAFLCCFWWIEFEAVEIHAARPDAWLSRN
jgi:hypothetical protein